MIEQYFIINKEVLYYFSI